LEWGVSNNTDGLIRPFFSQTRAVTDMGENDLPTGAAVLHHRPRKTLGFRAPNKVFFGLITPLRLDFRGESGIFL